MTAPPAARHVLFLGTCLAVLVAVPAFLYLGKVASAVELAACQARTPPKGFKLLAQPGSRAVPSSTEQYQVVEW